MKSRKSNQVQTKGKPIERNEIICQIEKVQTATQPSSH